MILKVLHVANFKAFAIGQRVPLRPITLIYGANSAEKSIPEIDRFVRTELERHGDAFSGRGRPDRLDKKESRDRLNEIFRSVVPPPPPDRPLVRPAAGPLTRGRCNPAGQRRRIVCRSTPTRSGTFSDP